MNFCIFQIPKPQCIGACHLWVNFKLTKLDGTQRKIITVKNVPQLLPQQCVYDMPSKLVRLKGSRVVCFLIHFNFTSLQNEGSKVDKQVSSGSPCHVIYFRVDSWAKEMALFNSSAFVWSRHWCALFADPVNLQPKQLFIQSKKVKETKNTYY